MTDIIKNQSDIYLGLDIGGTKCSVVVGNISFEIRRKVVFDTRTERGYLAILSEFQGTYKIIVSRNFRL